MGNGRDSYRDMGANVANKMRNRAQSIAEKRKQEYLGARVPRALREKILLRAEVLGIPVSILIRDILSEYIENVDSTAASLDRKVETDSKEVIVERERFSEVIGWETLKLNRTVTCSGCGKSLGKGEQVVFGVVPGKDHVILCGQCKLKEGLD